jgi:hypothetical protein
MQLVQKIGTNISGETAACTFRAAEYMASHFIIRIFCCENFRSHT